MVDVKYCARMQLYFANIQTGRELLLDLTDRRVGPIIKLKSFFYLVASIGLQTHPLTNLDRSPKSMTLFKQMA